LNRDCADCPYMPILDGAPWMRALACVGRATGAMLAGSGMSGKGGGLSSAVCLINNADRRGGVGGGGGGWGGVGGGGKDSLTLNALASKPQPLHPPRKF